MQKKYLTLLRHTSTIPQPTTPSRASEEDPTIDVTNTIGIVDNYLHYQGTTSRHKGQMHIIILILIENYSNTHYHNNSKHNSPHSIRNVHNTSNRQVTAIAPQSLSASGLIGSLQSQILGLQTQALQQPTLNSIKIFDATNKSEFTSWAQGVENAAWTHWV